MEIKPLEDNETIFKYSIDGFNFTHYNTTNEDGTTNDGRKLTEEEKGDIHDLETRLKIFQRIKIKNPPF